MWARMRRVAHPLREDSADEHGRRHGLGHPALPVVPAAGAGHGARAVQRLVAEAAMGAGMA